MGMLNSNDLKVGVVFKDGDSYIVLQYSHIKKGRGQATIKVKVRNLTSGAITIISYSNEQKVETADVEKKSAQYLYSDDSLSFFMDTTDFSQIQVDKDSLEDQIGFVKEGTKVVVMYLDGEPISIQIPKVVELEVTDTTAAVAGNTANSAMKNAGLETGLKVQVPLFVTNGDVIRVNTELKEYVSRV